MNIELLVRRASLLALLFASCAFPTFDAQGKACTEEDACPTGFLCLPRAGPQRTCQRKLTGADAQPRFFLGQFVRAGGAGTVLSQVVPHGLGVVPTALMMWTAGLNVDTGSPALFAAGFTDGVTARTVCWTDGTSSGGGALSAGSLAEHLLELHAPNGEVLAFADVTASDASSFTLQWSLTGASAFTVGFLALGGQGVQAKVLDWQVPEQPREVDILGSGFPPETVLSLSVAVPPGQSVSRASAEGAVSVMNAAGHAWSVARSRQSLPATGNFSAHAYGANAALVGVRSTSGAYQLVTRALPVAMQPDGFRLSFDRTEQAARVVSLALAGVASEVGTQAMPPLPQAQVTTSGFSFTPHAVLVSSALLDVGNAQGLSYDVLSSFGGMTAQAQFAVANRAQVSTANASGAQANALLAHLSREGTSLKLAQGTLTADGFSLGFAASAPSPFTFGYLALGPP